MDENENGTSRRRFLKQLGVTLAVALGAGALAESAFAAGQCCRNCNACGGCGGTSCYCYCDCSGIGESYCFVADAGCVAQGSGCIRCGC